MNENRPAPSLAQDFVDGRPGARDALLDAWLPQVLEWCARLGGPAVDPEDAAQDVLMVVLRRLPELEETERFSGWIFGVTRKVLAQHRRRAWVRRWVPGASTERASEEASPHRRAEATETGHAVHAILQQLPAKQREVLVLCEVEERSASEAATLLGIPSGTVKSRLRLGRARFRDLAMQSKLAPPRMANGGAP